MCKGPEPECNEAEHLGRAWSEVLADIRGYKKERYQLANYAVLLIAAVVGTSEKLKDQSTVLPRWVWLVAVAVLCIGSTKVLSYRRNALENSRGYAKEFRDQLGCAVTTVLKKGDGKPDNLTDWVVALVVVAAGIVAALWILLGAT